MRGLWPLAVLAALAACGGSDEATDQPPADQSGEGKTPQEQGGEEGSQAVIIKEYKDLEAYAGERITIEGKFGIWGKAKGKHATVTLDGGLVIYIPHAEAYWKGQNWWLYEGMRVQITGELHTYVDYHIDGMPGPYLHKVSGISETGEVPPERQPGVPQSPNPR